MSKPFSIFLADDDADDVSFFEEMLHKVDPAIVFHSARNGVEALDQLQHSPKSPDLIFLDLNMPMMDGKKCLQLLREDVRFGHTPVIMYTTSTYPGDIRQSLELGASCFVTKPTSGRELQAILQTIVVHTPDRICEGLRGLKQIDTQIHC